VPGSRSHRTIREEEDSREVTEDSREVKDGICKYNKKGRIIKEEAITATLKESDRH